MKPLTPTRETSPKPKQRLDHGQQPPEESRGEALCCAKKSPRVLGCHD